MNVKYGMLHLSEQSPNDLTINIYLQVTGITINACLPVGSDNGSTTPSLTPPDND